MLSDILTPLTSPYMTHFLCVKCTETNNLKKWRIFSLFILLPSQTPFPPSFPHQKPDSGSIVVWQAIMEHHSRYENTQQQNTATTQRKQKNTTTTQNANIPNLKMEKHLNFLRKLK